MVIIMDLIIPGISYTTMSLEKLNLKIQMFANFEIPFIQFIYQYLASVEIFVTQIV